jgi:hypothetical protein
MEKRLPKNLNVSYLRRHACYKLLCSSFVSNIEHSDYNKWADEMTTLYTTKVKHIFFATILAFVDFLSFFLSVAPWSLRFGNHA